MPDTRRHRGPHPDDPGLFGESALPCLQAATSDLSWLLSHGYAPVSSTKLVGDRYALTGRQRVAVSRCACSDESKRRRLSHQVDGNNVRGREVWIDGYNVLTTVEAALSGGVILHARDGCVRDVASMHGSYRKVAETVPAIRLIGQTLERLQVVKCRWLLDRPVSNSGRLKRLLKETASAASYDWDVELVQNPDADLAKTDAVVATADSVILDECQVWLNLARLVVAQIPSAWIINLGGEP